MAADVKLAAEDHKPDTLLMKPTRRARTLSKLAQAIIGMAS